MILSNVVLDALKETVGSWGLWSAIFATVAVIFLGYFLAYKKIFKAEWEKILVKVVMVVGLPALAFKGFMDGITVDKLIEQLAVLLIGFAFYLLMMIISKYFFIKTEKDLQDTFAMCIALASTTFFGIPVVSAIYGSASSMPANIFNVPYRVFLYSLAFMIMSKKHMAVSVKKIKSEMTQEEIIEGKKIKKQAMKNIFVNPILIATFLGFIIWITQLIPGIDILSKTATKYVDQGDGNFIQQEVTNYYSLLRVDILFPPFDKILTTMQAICTPLAWLAIGMTMNKGNLKEALKDKTLWYASVIKVVVAPTIIMLLIIAFASIGHYTNSFSITKIALGTMVIMTATPPANVVIAYAISYEKGAAQAGNLATLATLLSIITLPIWAIVVAAIGALPFFG